VLRTCLVLAQIGVLSGTLSAQQAQSSPPPGGAERAGRKIFQTRCAMCHVGQEPAVEMSSPNAERRPATMGPLLSRTNATNEATLKQKIKDGSVKMPGYKYTLSDQQIDQVVAFMKTIDKPMTRLFTDRSGQ
jgi:mono/diheme cytochrome c family protein